MGYSQYAATHQPRDCRPFGKYRATIPAQDVGTSPDLQLQLPPDKHPLHTRGVVVVIVVVIVVVVTPCVTHRRL